MTEPDVGSNIRDIQTSAELDNDSFILNGNKKWITLGQIADIFLVFAQYGGQHCAFIVEGNAEGLSRKPITGVLGLRANMLAEIEISNCRIPASQLLGKIGSGLLRVASSSLAMGRYTTAWGCVGLGQACIENSIKYICKRRQFGSLLREFQLTKKMLSEMVADVRAARLLCHNSGILYSDSRMRFSDEVLIAKYFSSKMINRVSYSAIQLHGANGLVPDFVVERIYRDARCMEIIEGVSQLYELLIAENEIRGYR